MRYMLAVLLLLSLDANAVTNPRRAYPPSCVSYPLPTTPSGPTQSIDWNAAGYPNGNFEPLRAVFWRKPCSIGKSVLLATVTRLAPRDLLVVLPLLQGTQDGQQGGVRAILEPNTYEALYFVQARNVQTFILEPAVSGFAIDTNRAFNLTAFDIGNGAQYFAGTVAAYNAASYPDAALPIPINGRITGSFFDTAHPGEGIFLEIGETGGVPVLFFAWFTYDSQGIPYWLIGQVSVPEGTRTIQIPTQYYAGGGFAGAFTSVQGRAWGTVTMSFPTCDRMTLQFASGAVPAGVPSGSGTRNWSRLLGADGFACE